jgi:hypothetical protein
MAKAKGEGESRPSRYKGYLIQKRAVWIKDLKVGQWDYVVSQPSATRKYAAELGTFGSRADAEDFINKRIAQSGK